MESELDKGTKFHIYLPATGKNKTISIKSHLKSVRTGECNCYVYFWLGISINSDTSSEPPISRKGQAFAINSAASIESASIIV